MDTDSNCSNGVTAAMEDLTTTDNQQMAAPVTTDEDSIDAAGSGEASTSGKKPSAVLNTRMKQLKPLINISSRYSKITGFIRSLHMWDNLLHLLLK